MADTVEVLNARVVIDASSAAQAQSQFNAAINNMASKSKSSFSDIATQIDRDLNAKFKDLEKQASQTEKEISKGFKAAADAPKSLSDQLKGLRSSFADIVTIAGTAVGTIGTAVVAFNALQKAAEFRGMAQASKNMAATYGVDLANITAKMREAGSGTFTAAQNFRFFNEALLANVETAEALPKLIEISHAAAIATGKDEAQVLETLIGSIERAQTRGISQAGIFLRLNDVVQEYADSHGVAADAIDLHTRQLLVLNAVLPEGEKLIQAVGKAADEEADTFERVKVGFSELGQTLLQFPTITGTVIGSLDAAVTAAAQLIAILGGAVAGGMTLAASAMQIGTIISAFGINVRVGGAKDFSDIAKDANKAFEDTFKRMTQTQGIIYTQMDDVRERARRKIMSQSQAFTTQETKAEADRLAKEKTARDKSAEIIISAGQRAHDAEQGMLQDMEELHIDHNNKLVDIAVDGARKREDIEIDTGRKVEDAGLDLQRAIEEAQQESANRRAQIEQRYQEKLIQIQRRFQDAYWNAVKNRDAVALVEAVRDRNRGIEDAGRQRDIDMSNEDRQSEERLQNAQLTHRRKLEDAQRYYDRAMYDQRLSERRAIDDENRNHQYRETEIRRHYQWRLDEIGLWLDAELIQARAKYAQSEADYSNHLAQMAAIAASYMAGLGIGGASEEGSTYYTNRKRKRQAGGVDLVTSPTEFLAGEGGPELVLTVPMGGGQHMLPAPMSHMVTGDVRHQVDMITANGMRGMEGRIIAAVMQAMREVYRR